MGAPNQLRRATLSASGTVTVAHVLAGCIKGLHMMHTDGAMLLDGAIQPLKPRAVAQSGRSKVGDGRPEPAP
jgi:hypothetical protein